MTDDELLAPGPPSADPAMRAALLKRTTRRLGRRQRVRRFASSATLVLAGVAAGWLGKPDPAPRVERVEVPVEVRVEVPAPAPSPSPVAAAPPTPERLELDAELADDRGEASRLYRLAGDAFLAPRRDYAEAARCYRLSLQAAPPAARQAAAEDSWLLARMKGSFTQEVSP